MPRVHEKLTAFVANGKITGVIGGVPASGLDFGAAVNIQALIQQGELDMAFIPNGRISDAIRELQRRGIDVVVLESASRPGGRMLAERISRPLTDVAAINARFDKMLEQGALEEVRAFAARKLDPTLPATKAQPKEMLPVVDRPSIQYVVEEAVAAGIDDILIITGRNKRSLEDHFDRNFELEYHLAEKGKTDDLADVIDREPRHLGRGRTAQLDRPLPPVHPVLVHQRAPGRELRQRPSLFADEVVQAHQPGRLQPGVEDVVFLNLLFADGKMAQIQVSWLDPRKERRLTVVGERRMVEFDDSHPTEKLRIYDKGFNRPPEFTQFGEFLTVRNGDIHIPHVDLPEPLNVECRHFIDSIHGGTSPRTGAKEGLDVIRVLHAAEKSLKNQGIPVAIEAD